MKNEALTAVTLSLQDALLEVREAAQAEVDKYGDDAAGLVKLINDNAGKWPSSTHCAINIVEDIVRFKANAALYELIRVGKLTT